MENLKTFDGLKTKVTQIDAGIITTIKAENGVSQQGFIDYNGKTVLANYIYKKDETYNLVYTIVDSNGKVEGHFAEYIGVVPTLFKSPDNEIYVSLADTRTDKELEISIPLLNREAFDEPKHTKPYAGKYIGTVNKNAVFHDVDIFSDKKPDTMLSMLFANETIKKRNIIKLDFPKDNNIYLQ